MQALRSTRRAPGLALHSRGFLTAAAYKLAQKQMPKMSETEKVALGCGTVGFDRDIFTGSPSLKHLLDTYNPKLSAEEQAFLDHETVELCKLLDDHKVTADKDFTAEAWDYMRDKGFFGMKIPKEWGGLGFSTMCVSSVLAKLGSHCFDANATVAVPNSLGPGELLVRYGTSAQQARTRPCTPPCAPPGVHPAAATATYGCSLRRHTVAASDLRLQPPSSTRGACRPTSCRGWPTAL